MDNTIHERIRALGYDPSDSLLKKITEVAVTKVPDSTIRVAFRALQKEKKEADKKAKDDEKARKEAEAAATAKNAASGGAAGAPSTEAKAA